MIRKNVYINKLNYNEVYNRFEKGNYYYISSLIKIVLGKKHETLPSGRNGDLKSIQKEK